MCSLTSPGGGGVYPFIFRVALTIMKKNLVFLKLAIKTYNHRYRSVILKSSSNLGAYRSTSHFNHAMGFWSYKIGLLNVKKQEEKRIELVTNRKPPAPACYVLGAWRKTSKALASHF